MALGATVYRFKIDYADVERALYQSFDLRVARHPSESVRYLLARVLAYCLCHEEGIAFSKGGLSDTEEPALSVRDLQGNLQVWIEVGAPAAERLHKASKVSPRVVIVTHGDPETLRRGLRGKIIHKAQEIQVYAFDPAFLDALEPITDRNAKWDLVHTGGELYLNTAGQSVSGAVIRQQLVDPPGGVLT